MTATDDIVAGHYGQADLFDRIVAAFAAADLPITLETLKPVDEFHVGGAEATGRLLEALDIPATASLLDIGSGIGGPARMIASKTGAQVIGLDLTPDYVSTANRLTERLEMERVRFVQGSALDMPFAPQTFDVATLLHVGMNIPDKAQLMSQARRVLKPGGRLAVYDVMRFGAHPPFPLPWAADPKGSFLAAPDAYLDAAKAAGLVIEHRADRGAEAKAFFKRGEELRAAGKLPPVGLPLIMDDPGPRFANLIASINSGDVAPVEMIFRSPDP